MPLNKKKNPQTKPSFPVRIHEIEWYQTTWKELRDDNKIDSLYIFCKLII